MLVVSESQDQLTDFRTELLGFQCFILQCCFFFSITCLKVLAKFLFLFFKYMAVINGSLPNSALRASVGVFL